jgi:hypothetical protein
MHELSASLHSAGDRHKKDGDQTVEALTLKAKIEAKTVYDVAAAMHAAGEHMTIAAMKITDIDQILRLQVRQMKYITEEVRRLRELVDRQGGKDAEQGHSNGNNGGGNNGGDGAGDNGQRT